MTFYVRRSKDSEVEGPFTVEQINQMLRQKRLTLQSLSVAAIGQGLQAVQSTPPEQWIKLSETPGFQPDPDEESKYVLLILVIFALLVLIPIAALIMLAVVLNRIH